MKSSDKADKTNLTFNSNKKIVNNLVDCKKNKTVLDIVRIISSQNLNLFTI